MDPSSTRGARVEEMKVQRRCHARASHDEHARRDFLARDCNFLTCEWKDHARRTPHTGSRISLRHSVTP
jgi:hypothetical protein